MLTTRPAAFQHVDGQGGPSSGATPVLVDASRDQSVRWEPGERLHHGFGDRLAASLTPPPSSWGVSLRWAALPQAPPGWRSGVAPSDAVRLRAVRHPRQHDLSALAVALLRAEVAALLGVDPLEVALRWACPGCGGVDHGRPLVDGAAVDVSVAHAGDLAVVAVSTAGAVGVDVEVAAPGRAAAELRPWVRAEAALKATGEGLAGDAAAALAACDVRDLPLGGAPPGVVVALALLPPP